MVKRTASPKILSLANIIGAGLAVQLLSIQPLWDHESDVMQFLGRYSNRYAIALVLNIVLIGGWLAAFVWRRKVEQWLHRLPASWRCATLVLSGVVTLGIWFISSLDGSAKIYVTLNWLLLVMVLLQSLRDQPVRFRGWLWLWLGFVLVLLFPMFIGALSGRRFTPDEAVWADMASSAFLGEGIYARVNLEKPFLIEPGRGWSVAAYGWLLTHVSFDLLVGRIWNFAANLVAFVGIGALAARLYGRKAALISVIFAILARGFIQVVDYRPDHQLSGASVFIVLAAVQAHHSRRPFSRYLWHFTCGLLGPLSMELHAAGIVFAFGLSLFYLGEYMWLSYQQRRMAPLTPVLAFGAGAALGAGLFYLFNIVPVGGLDVFLGFLTNDRGERRGALPFLRGFTFLEKMVVWGALAYIIGRRNANDRLFLGILASILVGIMVLDTQGYYTTFIALFVVPVGTLLVNGFGSATLAPGNNRRAAWVTSAVLAAMILQLWFNFLSSPAIGQWFRTGKFPPNIYQELGPMLEPFITDDDVIVSTPELIWGLPEHPHLVAAAAEPRRMRDWELDEPIEVWERVQPTVVIDTGSAIPLTPGLIEYLDVYQFVVCEDFQAFGRQILIYREECPAD
ncbi:MAG: hypothetical protein JW963_12440 [Anaerolineales bacterium]|nr:hypothetical protein [Anaerolineales bacterium]